MSQEGDASELLTCSVTSRRCSFLQVPPGADPESTLVYKVDDGVIVYDQCLMHEYDNSTGLYSNDTTQCTHGWHYDDDPITSSIATEVR